MSRELLDDVPSPADAAGPSAPRGPGTHQDLRADLDDDSGDPNPSGNGPDDEDLDDAGRTDPTRRGPRWVTLAACVALALVLGAVAGFEESQRRSDRLALESTTVLAWTTGFDGATGGNDAGGDGPGSGSGSLTGGATDGTTGDLRLQLSLVALTGRPVTLTRIGDDETLRLDDPVDLEPGYPSAAVVASGVRCTQDRSTVSGARTATVRSERGVEAVVPLRVVARGLDSVLDEACRTRVVEPARVVGTAARPDGAVEVSVRASDGVAPSYLTVDVAPGRTGSWAVEVDPPGTIALIPGRTQTYAFTLTYLRCSPGAGNVERPPMMPDTRSVLTTSVVTGFTGDPRPLAGWDDAVVAQAAIAAVARACT